MTRWHAARYLGAPFPFLAMDRIPNRKRVLVVDDELQVRRFLSTYLRDYVEVHVAEDAAGALELVRSMAFDVVLTDECMPGPTGTWLLKQVASVQPRCKRVLMSGTGQPHDTPEVRRVVQRFVEKPFPLHVLVAEILADDKDP